MGTLYDVLINIRVSEDDRDWFHMRARELGMNGSTYLRFLIKREREKYEHQANDAGVGNEGDDRR